MGVMKKRDIKREKYKVKKKNAVSVRGSISMDRVFTGLAGVLAVALISILIAGVLSAQIGNIFTQLNVTGPWTGLKTSAESYITTTFSLVLIALLLVGFAIILGVLRTFGGATAGGEK
jgi:replication initiation and membrane attachment protein DnaB